MSETMSEADGLAQVRALLATGRQPSMGETLGVSLVEVDRGRSVFEGRPDASVLNPMGGVHGGYAAAMLDSACGIATHSSLKAGQAYTTLELKISYIRGLTSESGLCHAEGRVVSVGRRVAFAEATLHDERGPLCATATSTLLVFAAQPSP